MTASILGDQGEEYLGQLSEFSYAFEKIIKILVDHVENVNERVDAVEGTTEKRIAALESAVANLAHNIQGFDNNAERLEDEARKRDEYREQIKKANAAAAAVSRSSSEQVPASEAVSRASKTADERPAAGGSAATDGIPQPGMRPDGTKRNETAMRRWRWAAQQMRMKRMMGRLNMTGVKVTADKSVGARLQKLEEMMDDMAYRYEMAAKSTGEDPGLGKALKEQVRLMQKTLDKLKSQLGECEERVATSALKWDSFDEDFRKLADGVSAMEAQVESLDKIKKENEAELDGKERAYKLALYQVCSAAARRAAPRRPRWGRRSSASSGVLAGTASGRPRAADGIRVLALQQPERQGR